MIYMTGYNPKHARMKLFGLDSLIGGAIGGVTSLIGGAMQRGAAEDAAKKGNQLLSDASGKAQSYLNPYIDAGQTGLNKVQSMVSNPQQFTMADFYNDPGYQFQLQQGNQAIERSAAARGGLTSGATGKALANYTTNLANTTYGDAYNRYLQTNNQQFNQANTLANYGYNASNQSANNTIGVAGQQANNLTSAITGGAAAMASGLTGAANAAQGSLANYYLQNAINNGSGYGGGNPYMNLSNTQKYASSLGPVDYAGSDLRYGIGN
jgi:hypothetical protein